MRKEKRTAIEIEHVKYVNISKIIYVIADIVDLNSTMPHIIAHKRVIIEAIIYIFYLNKNLSNKNSSYINV